MIELTLLDAEHLHNVLSSVKEDPEILPEIQEELQDAVQLLEAAMRS